jgi:hypothetical protein
LRLFYLPEWETNNPKAMRILEPRRKEHKMSRLEKLERDEAEAQKAWEAVHGAAPEGEGAESHEEAGDKGVAVQGEASSDGQKPENQSTPKDEGKTRTKEQELADEGSQTWAQKYRTIEGKYRVEVPRLNQEVRQWKDHAIALNGKITDLERVVAELSSKTASAESTKEIEALTGEYPDIGKVIKKLNDDHRAEMQALEARLTKGVASEINSVRENVAMSKKDKFDMLMRQAGVEDWAEIDTDPGFIAFLADTPSPYTDKTKHQLMLEAAEKMDVKKVALFFKEYKDSINGSAPVEEKVDEGQEKLKNFIAPPKGTGPKAPSGPAKQTYTREDYTKFMKESASGKFNSSKWGGKTEDQVEAMFDKIIAEGQLR